MIRIGRCTYDRQGKRTDPSYPGFTPIIILMKGHNKWGSLGPYELKDDNGIILENYWQGAKCYAFVPETIQRYSRWDSRIIWQHSSEIHYDQDRDQILPAYWTWRNKLMHNLFAVRYPVGFNHRHKCLFAIKDNDVIHRKLDYIQARKEIYVQKYCELVRQQQKFKELEQRLDRGENLLIIEVDGPHQQSLNYYRDNYNVNDDFIEQNTMLALDENLHIMLNDDKHPFGHGYCLAIALLELDYLADL